MRTKLSEDKKIAKLEEIYKQREKVEEEIRNLKRLLWIEKGKVIRNKSITFWVTEDEWAQIENICEKYNHLSRNELLREIVFGEIDKINELKEVE